MFDNPKRAFIEAFFLAIIVFIIGIMLGVSYEDSRLNAINDYYSLSEVSLMDSIALGKITDLKTLDCSSLIASNIGFADKIYNEALTLEQYEETGSLTDSMMIAHKKYDVLRTLLWINVINSKETCKNGFSDVVYLYEYNPDDLQVKADQIVWSRILFDVKQKYADDMILIPIAVNSNISSLDYLMKEFKISKYPAVIINEKNVIYNLESSEDIEKYLK
jgi:hypothetical protein